MNAGRASFWPPQARTLTPVPGATAAPLRLLCGSERWLVETLDDSDRWKVDLTPRARTIKQFNKLVNRRRSPRTAA